MTTVSTRYGIAAAGNEEPPHRLVGLWRRCARESPAQRDFSSEVYWLQTREHFVDIRLPAGWPEQRQGLDCCAGTLRVEGDIITRQRWWSISPMAQPDIGRMSGTGDVLEEHGVLRPFRERWERLCDHRLPRFALLRAGGEGPDTLLVGIGNYFMLAEPDGAAGCRVRFGFLRSQSGPWRVCASSAPELTGQHWRAGFHRHETLGLCDATGQPWQVLESSMSLDILLPR